MGETFEERHRARLLRRRAVAEMGTDVTEFKQPWGKAYFAPVYDFGSKEIVAGRPLQPDMEQQGSLLDRLLERMPERREAVPQTAFGILAQSGRRLKAEIAPRAYGRKGAAQTTAPPSRCSARQKTSSSEEGHGPTESFKADLDAHRPLGRRRQVKLEDWTPEEFRASPEWRSLYLSRPSFGAQFILRFEGSNRLLSIPRSFRRFETRPSRQCHRRRQRPAPCREPRWQPP